jgi:multidrug efflux system outer membrane protein
MALSMIYTLKACAPVGPNYQEPSIDLPSRFVDGDATASGEVAAQKWWLSFGDTTLNTLVDRGMAQNLDVRTAVERIRQAEAALSATGQASQVIGSASASSTVRYTSDTHRATTNSGGLAANYVLDIFGGARRGREQATAALEGAFYDVGTARLAFLALLVGNYIDARYFQEAIALTHKSIETRRQTVALTRQRRELGVISRLDYLNVEALLNEALADLPEIEAEFYAATFSIATLLGEPASPITEALERAAPQPNARGNAGAGVPADVLRNRPDVISSERELAAATAAIGVATASLYPSLDLDGTITSSDPSSWSFGPTVSLPILNQGVLRAARNEQISLARQAELTWRNAVLSAVEDVQIAQSSYQRSRREVEAHRKAAASYQSVLDLSTQTYHAGTISLLELLDAQRSNATSQLSLAASVQELANSWAILQIAAGRGWVNAPLE